MCLYRKYSKITPWCKNRLLDFCAMVLFFAKFPLLCSKSSEHKIWKKRRWKLNSFLPSRNPHTHPTKVVFLFCICYFALHSQQTRWCSSFRPFGYGFIFIYISLIISFFSGVTFVYVSASPPLLLLEIKKILILFFFSIFTSSRTRCDLLILSFFSVFVIEGVIALRGLIALIRFSGR